MAAQRSDPQTDGGKPDQVFHLLEMLSLDLRGNLQCAQGHMQEGVALLKMAAEKERNDVGYAEPPTSSRPESESLGYAYLRAKEFQKAREAFQQELDERPNSGHALYGIVISHELAGASHGSEAGLGRLLSFLEGCRSRFADGEACAGCRSIRPSTRPVLKFCSFPVS